jgi:dihydroxy-acid dehydratase
LTKTELAERRKTEEAKGNGAFKPQRNRIISESLRAYAFFTASADKGAVRVVPEYPL